MGFWGNVGQRVRGLLRFDKDQVAVTLAKGNTATSAYPQAGFDLLQTYGYDVLADYLKLEQDLTSRFIEYEDMDEYPVLSCIYGDSMVFTMEFGWKSVRELSEFGKSFHVLSYSSELRSLVPSRATKAFKSGNSGHSKQMVRVVMDNGQTIVCTSDHLFMSKYEGYIEAGKLDPGQRLMPGEVRIRSLNDSKSESYWQVYQPQGDFKVSKSRGKNQRWTWLHRLVAEKMFRALEKDEVVHHIDENPLNNAPGNLSIETKASHAAIHLAGIDNTKYFPEWTQERRDAMSKRTKGNTFSLGNILSDETKKKISIAGKGRKKSPEHRKKIGEANRIIFDRATLEGALSEGGSIKGAARVLGVSWNVVKKSMADHDISMDNNNHRVVRVELVDSREDLYDIEVPEFHNFVCNGVVIHNSALDIYAEESTQTDALKNKVVWAEASDRTVQEIINDLLDNRLRLDEELFSMARTLAKYGNCVRHDAIVRTAAGPKTIKDVEPGEYVQICKDGRLVLRKVNKKFNNGVKKTYRVKTVNREVYLTENHPVMTTFDGKVSFVQVRDLRTIKNETGVVGRRSIPWVVVVGLVDEDGRSQGIESEPLISVTESDFAEVYDLEIDDEAHNFVANGIVVHNSYEELLVTQDGLVGLNFLPPATIRRIEGRRGELFGFIQDFKGRFGYDPNQFKQLLNQRTSGGGTPESTDKLIALEDWEVCHTRLRSKNRRSCYGHGILEPARFVFKRLMLMEDAAMVYRLERSPQRLAFYVDTGDLPPKEAFSYLNKVKNQYKKTKFLDPQTGKLNMKFNPLGQSEDFFIPIRKGIQSSRIDTIDGPMWNSIEDIEYFNLKMFAAIKIPKTYLGFGDATGKSTLSAQDARFARTVLRLQRELRNGIKKMVRVHLAALNINPAAVDFEIYMTVPSSIFELAQLEVRNAKADFAGRMSQFVSLHWILQKVFGLSEEEIEYVIKERHEEQLADAEIQAKSMGLQTQVQGDVQMAQQAQQQQAIGQQGTQAAGTLATAAPNTAKSDQASAQFKEAAALSRMWALKGRGLGKGPINERELFAGNRDHEKKMEDNLDKILRNDTEFLNKFKELKELLDEIRMSRPRSTKR